MKQKSQKLRIGIDLDNTIISYDQAFQNGAVFNGLVEKGCNLNKKALRAIIRKMPEGEFEWGKNIIGEDVFATDVADAAAMADVRFEAANIDTASKKMCELAGDTTDPGGYYYIAVTFSAAGGTIGTLSWNITYVVN